MEIKFKNVTLFKNQSCCSDAKVLKNLSFELKGNKIFAFLGNSSSGKTTLCELMSFLEKPTHGFIKVGSFVNDGKIKNTKRLRFNIGYVYKRPNEMFVCKTVKKELEFSLKNFKFKTKTKNERILNSLKMVGLNEEYLDLDPMRISLNEQKKLALACILIYNPKIIIIDEPTIGLNNKEKKDLVRILKILKNKYKKMVILMSKDSDFVYSLVDYVYIINKGEIVKSGAKSILTNSKFLNKYRIKVPEIVKFVDEAREKNIKLNYYDNISDLIKGVYRSAGK